MKLKEEELKRLEEIKKRLAAVPPAPWRSIYDDPDDVKKLDCAEETTVYSTDESIPEDDRFVLGLLYYDGMHSACREEEAKFIAESRSDIPWLMSLIERLRDE